MRYILSVLLALTLCFGSGCVFTDKGTPDTVVTPVPVQGGTNTVIEHDKTVTPAPPADSNVNVHVSGGTGGAPPSGGTGAGGK